MSFGDDRPSLLRSPYKRIRTGTRNIADRITRPVRHFIENCRGGPAEYDIEPDPDIDVSGAAH
ncbi:hypothetical protein ACFYY8_18445 [Streptosporangium sp. NPDC001559]|uniref:hypothetical protein n=1 Tax=Streptosporangium sp. NPDC001559 TaxID=3366187 RepID=UPI0036E589E8